MDMPKRISTLWLAGICLTALLAGSAIGVAFTSNTVSVSVTQRPVTGILLSVNGTSGVTFSGPTYPGDILVIAATVSPVLSGRNISFYYNVTTYMNSGLTNAAGTVVGNWLVPALTNSPNGDIYVFSASAT